MVRRSPKCRFRRVQAPSANCEGSAYDPGTGLLFVPSQTRVGYMQLTHDPEASDIRYISGPSAPPEVFDIPIVKPPWGRITAIDLATGAMMASDMRHQTPVGPRPLAFRTVNPVIVSTRGNFKNIAHQLNVMEFSVFPDKGVLYLSSLAKYAAAFFRISFSSLSRSFSCFSVTSSG